MIKNIKKLFNITATLVIGSLILWNCEPDADQLGSQFFQDGAKGTDTAYTVIAYNVNNGEAVRSDAARLQSATLGAFNEPQFGLQKSAYVSQVRLSSYSPDFGTNPVLDSAVLVIKPIYPTDSATTTTVEDYIYPVGAVAAKKVVTNYPVSKYGRTKINGKTIFNIKVHEVNEFLGSAADSIMSDRNVAVGNVIGSKVFDGTINSIKITKDSDNSELFVRDVSLRIPMDSTFMQNKIIKKGSSPELSDAASFIRYFKGLQISVLENDGYIFSFDPNTVTVNLYYKKDKVENGTTTREPAVYSLDMGSSNAHFSQITNNRAGTPSAIALTPQGQDAVTGVPKIYAQGMGGPGIGLKIPEATIATIKNMFQTKKIGIISAKLRLYTDQSTWDNKYQKPSYFVVKQKDLNTYLEDMSTLANTGVYSLVKAYDLDKSEAHYDIGITQTFKNIIEKEAIAKDFILNVGSYTTDAAGNLLGALNIKNSQDYNTRAYTPNRAVFVGTDPNNISKSAKLILTYGKK
ncbi:DUF4270 domain-containing protein [Kaistella sp. DKR-2]|uniref:DUF4270 family protein n=1 Tax=Kaistella soli TaxID=2849654 RepID=UPI001C252B0D|nr:DUF4270 family protein [Kaistella soli]MBU8882904.1 DUF4270 domain-containing protein [Kaistella soli]